MGGAEQMRRCPGCGRAVFTAGPEGRRVVLDGERVAFLWPEEGLRATEILYAADGRAVEVVTGEAIPERCEDFLWGYRAHTSVCSRLWAARHPKGETGEQVKLW